MIFFHIPTCSNLKIRTIILQYLFAFNTNKIKISQKKSTLSFPFKGALLLTRSSTQSLCPLAAKGKRKVEYNVFYTHEA